MINKYLLALLFLTTPMLSFAQGAGNFVSFQKNRETLSIRGTKGILKIQAYTADIFKVQVLASDNAPLLDTSYSVRVKPAFPLGQVAESKDYLDIEFSKCRLHITKSPLKVALLSGTEVKIGEISGFEQVRDSIRFVFSINPQAVFHGAGGRPFGPDLNRKAFDFYNSREFAYYDQATGLAQGFNVPFLVSSHQYGILFDSDKPGSMRMYVGAPDSTKLIAESLSAGKWAYYLINGESNDEILESYTWLTGRQPLPPRWALGYIQSKSGYKNLSEATGAITKLQDQGFPVDALVLDQSWFGDESLTGNFDWFAKNWPDPAGMIRNLKASGVKTILTSDPHISTKSSNFSFAQTNSFFIQKPLTGQTYTQDIRNVTVGTLDIFRPAVQNWLWANYKRLANQGIAGWWTDRTEPDYHPTDAVHVNGQALQVHNLYPLAWSENLYTHFQKEFSKQRLFNLTSSGAAGSQRNGILPRSGDVARYWAGLRLQIPIILQAGMSGIGYMHSDIGGFATMPDKTDKDEELDLRWFQFGTFTPVMRNHGQRDNIEPFNLSEPFYSAVKNYIRVRYQLLPYLYSLSWKNSLTGRPICMPMDYFTESRLFGSISDQYFFGENLLVAPVLLHGMPTRKVVLPEGKWFDFWTNEVFAGNTNIFPKLSVGQIPVYARAGSFIPLATSTSQKSTDQYSSDSLTIRFFQDISVPASRFSMFHDDGADPASLQNGTYEIVDFSGRVSEDSIIVTTERTKDFAQAIARRTMLFEIENLTSSPISVTLNGKPVQVVYLESEWGSGKAYYNLVKKQLKVSYDWECKTPAILAVARDGLSVVTGTEKPADETALNIYPNPGFPGSRLTVEAAFGQTGNYTLEIFDAAGRKINTQQVGTRKKGSAAELYFSSPATHGAYVMKLSSDEGRSISKTFVIE